MWIHDMINKQDIKSIRSQVNPDNVNTKNSNNETPLEFMIMHYSNKWKFPLSSLILQHLINMGADKSPCMNHVQKCIDEITFDPSTKKFYIQVAKAKQLNKTSSSNNSKHNKSRSIHNDNVPQVSSNKSQYSIQEKLQLDRIAGKLGIPIQNNHLALKIINQLLKNNLCIGCTQNSSICKECFNPHED
jgi:hypothetical protein